MNSVNNKSDEGCPHHTPNCFGQAGDYFGYMCNKCEEDNLRAEIKRLQAIVEKADALAETIDHAHDLCASMDFIRERIEELRESISEPWRLQYDDFNAAVRETANRHEAVNELYEYTARMDMIKTAAKVYQEARHAG